MFGRRDRRSRSFEWTLHFIRFFFVRCINVEFYRQTDYVRSLFEENRDTYLSLLCQATLTAVDLLKSLRCRMRGNVLSSLYARRLLSRSFVLSISPVESPLLKWLQSYKPVIGFSHIFQGRRPGAGSGCEDAGILQNVS